MIGIKLECGTYNIEDIADYGTSVDDLEELSFYLQMKDQRKIRISRQDFNTCVLTDLRALKCESFFKENYTRTSYNVL